jgi:hypothetical protein
MTSLKSIRPQLRFPSLQILAVALVGVLAGCKDKTSSGTTGGPPTSTARSLAKDAPSTPQVASTVPRAAVARGRYVPSSEDAMQVQQAEHTFPAEALLEELKQRSFFFERYRGRVVEVDGKVGRVGKDDKGPYVTLRAGDDDTLVACYTIAKAPGAKVGRGMLVKVRGLVPADDSAPLRDCILVQVSPGPATVVSAVDLSKEFADPAEAKEKYRGKYLVVSGEIVKKDEDPSGNPRISLKGDGKFLISCTFASKEEADAAASRLEVGKTVKLGGAFLLAASNIIALSNCVTIPD